MLNDLFSGKKNGASNMKYAIKELPPTGVTQYGKVAAQWTEVTAEFAARALESLNTQNRRPRESSIKRIARSMERGSFRITHQAIAFDESGILIDGQHRLEAIVRTGKPQWMLVVTGLKPMTREVTDTGTARTPADQLRICGGEERASLVSKILSALRRAVTAERSKCDYSELVEFRKPFENGIQWAIANVGAAGKWTSAPVVAALVFAHKRHPDLVNKIYYELETGACAPGDIVMHFRDLLLQSNLMGEKWSGEVFAKMLTVIWHRARGTKSNRIFATKEAFAYFEKAYA